MIFLTNIWQNPSVVGIIAGVPSIAVVILGWLVSRSKDAAVKKVGADAGKAEFMRLVQEDNTDLRQRMDKLESENPALRRRIVALEGENTKLRSRVSELERGNGSQKR